MTRHRGVHVAGAGAREDQSTNARTSGRLVRALRDAHGAAAFMGEDLRHARGGLSDRTGLARRCPRPAGTIRALLRRCLQKDPHAPPRFGGGRSAGDRRRRSRSPRRQRAARLRDSLGRRRGSSRRALCVRGRRGCDRHRGALSARKHRPAPETRLGHRHARHRRSRVLCPLA